MGSLCYDPTQPVGSIIEMIHLLCYGVENAAQWRILMDCQHT